MSTLSTLNTRLNEVLKSSETRNLTTTQRDRALNDALLFDVQYYRPWPDLVVNRKNQAVSGFMNIPGDYDKAESLHYGSSASASTWNEYLFIDQTDFLKQVGNTATITDDGGIQKIQLYPADDQGVDQSNTTADTDLGLFNISANTQTFQTFTTETTGFKGAMIRLKAVESPTSTATLTLGLYATSSSLPTGTALKTATLSVADLSTSYENYYFDLPYTTTASTEYALVLSTDESAADATNYVAWQYSGTSQISDGTRGIYDGATYTTATGDMYFLTYNEVFNFQYLKTLTEMTASTSDTGVDKKFDEAIVMLAAARLYERWGSAGRSDTDYYGAASVLRYGNGGNQSRPTQDSAYGRLNTIWDNERTRTRRPHQRLRNFYENHRPRRRGDSDRSYLAYNN